MPNFKQNSTKLPKPYCEYVFGIRLSKPAWIPQTVDFVAEDGFVMMGNELLKSLENQIKKYKVTEINLYDHAQDTDAEIIFDCRKDKVILKGALGNTTDNGFMDNIKTTFNIEVNKEILKNLYNVLKEHSI